ncbi:MAG: glycosyltransferase family 4 protein [Pseudomonadales bacterium]|nr:glycosyltransferase family 4 protein [Pseudomonadales bacterium]
MTSVEKKVLIAVPIQDYGGEELRSSRIYRGLQRHFNCHLLSQRSDFESESESVHLFPDMNSGVFRDLLILARLIREERFDAVLLFKRRLGFYGFVLERFFPKVKFYFNVANFWQDKNILWKFCPSNLITLSSLLIPERERNGFSEVAVVPIGTELADHFVEFDDLGIKYGSIRLVSAGKLNYQKNHELLLVVANLLAENVNREVIVDIAGDGPNRAYLETMELHPRVRLVLRGQVTDMGSFFMEGGIYVQTSRYEGMPNALLEAGCFGLPIVAANVGATSELISERTGWLVDNTSDQSEYLERLLEVISTPVELIEQTRLALREKIHEQHSIENMIAGYVEVINGDV